MLFLFKIRPKVEIANELCRSIERDRQIIYRVKIVNKTRNMLIVNNYTLNLCNTNSNGIKNIENIEPQKEKISFIEKYSHKDTESDYAVRLTFLINEKEINENTELIFNLLVTHTLSNTTSCIQKVYRKSDIKTGMYETGDSTKVLEYDRSMDLELIC